MTPSDDPPLSLRPQPVDDKKPKNLAEFIARVHAQPGGFRALSEAKLQEDIGKREEQEQNGELTVDEDVQMADGDDDEEASAAQDPTEARMEVLKNIDVAGNTALLTLDFLSLLLSKQNPTQASTTLSQGLRDLVGIGTMGADRLDESNITETKVQDQEEIAIGWTLMETNKACEAAEAAREFLDAEMTAEGKYWEEIMAVQKSGWSISRVPQERHSLGVRFGFSEAAVEFRSNGLAPMRRGEDGAVQLDCGRLGGVSERLVIVYERDGKITGRSALPAHTTDDAPLEARVLEARNTIFSQELWHELTREARTLAAYDVKPVGSRLLCAVDPTSNVSIELVPLGSEPFDEPLPDNKTAESISLALHVLLSYAHRHNELMRTRPMPPHIPRHRGQQTHALLRPIVARIVHTRSIRACVERIGALVQALQRAGLPSSFILKTPPSMLVDGHDAASRGPNQPSISLTLIRNMLQPIDFHTKVTLLPDIFFTVRGRTFLFPVTDTYYNVLLPAGSPLASLCPPYKDGYPDLKALTDFIHTAAARVLAEHFLPMLPSPPPGDEWVKSVGGNSIRHLDSDDLELTFDVVDRNDAPCLIVTKESNSNGKPDDARWVWSADPRAPSEASSVQDIVSRVF
ncbi:subunit 17 of mediator complex-domain-containing protein [Thelonectria olida]|uniref:Mediator of RNA polymerase II transcription subunit 17 n=1 Tax=Thelonectria olida TaxID=1576542 RepID=A0A9P8W1N3_9HYPO|nr:subunit 17 of mediator complex-domain-containing protein [Thelonectria olida]